MLTTTQLEAEIGAVAIPFIIGLLIGLLIRKIISVGVILLALVVLLLALGYIRPEQISAFLQMAGEYAQQATTRAHEISGFIPYSSLSFVIGFVIGIVKG
ncbi:hypothetical protein HS1genome_1364 [Sulfodiicoccus acidiphilus]|uniref:FUN14 family protein n=1 Tax=Sulfodiicoccus acidiphilus TaxID=1670455 RepID=A0A348B473_9CREN|nr:hypothetical protein [Sulfodiicoccus acidiphilus]BBD72975.1 hypothetical protein HS1genome_1364 [Sulfodiicoccus acidiphilus]GGT87606.1 hypothetical protein GCM10007116_01910 [Sulfodiicoccus acidiphilus]